MTTSMAPPVLNGQATGGLAADVADVETGVVAGVASVHRQTDGSILPRFLLGFSLTENILAKRVQPQGILN
jgi:hypothetical protein